MAYLKFYDCNCFFGRRAVINPGSFYKVEDLAANMERYGIARALVYHSMARECSPAVGNRMLMDEIKPYNFLEPVWTVMPHHTGEFTRPDELILEMKKNNIRAAVIFPSAADHGYSLAEWNTGELLSALGENGIPLLIEADQFDSWNEIHDILSLHESLNIILTNVNYRIDRNLYPLLKKFRNLFIETSGYKVHQGIEEICAAFGANRLVYGSNMPVYSGAAAVSMLNYASISLKEKEMIAFENLNQLLGGDRP